MSDTDVCSCDHVRDEHGHDQEFPGSTACNVDDCECVAFELAESTADAVDRILGDAEERDIVSVFQQAKEYARKQRKTRRP